jgi:hypothetical protein
MRSESKKGSSRRRASASDDAALPDSYPALVSDLEKRIAGARLRAALSVNRELILLYFHHRSALFQCITAPVRTFCRVADDVGERGFRDLSGLACQIGFRTERTAAVSITSIGNFRSGAAYSFNIIAHCARCFSLRHSDCFAATNSSAHSPNVGMTRSAVFAAARASSGSRPAATIARHSAATSRARASDTSRAEPSPRFPAPSRDLPH